MPLAGFETAIAARKRRQTHDLDSAAGTAGRFLQKLIFQIWLSNFTHSM